MPVASRPCGERALTLAIRTALLNFVMVAAGANAWAETPTPAVTDDSTPSLTLDTTTIDGRYNGPTALPEVLSGGQVARGARLGAGRAFVRAGL